MLKKFVRNLPVILMTIALFAAIGYLAYHSGQQHATPQTEQYPLMMCVGEVNGNEITAIDANGNEWVFTDDTEEQWSIDDYVAMILDDNGTPDYVYDDIIVQTRYTGFAELWEREE